MHYSLARYYDIENDVDDAESSSRAYFVEFNHMKHFVSMNKMLLTFLNCPNHLYDIPH